MSLLKAVIKKLGIILLTLLLVSFAVYAAFELIPGDPALSKLGTDATPEALAALRHEMGLDKPFIFRYFSWLLSCLKGDFGISLSYGRTVSSMIISRIPVTVFLTLFSTLITVVVSIPVAVLMTKYAGRFFDRFTYVVNQLVMSVPSFFAGILFTWFFGMILKLFKPGGYVSYDKDLPGFLFYILFPSIAVALPKCAMSVKLLRSSILEEADKDYVRTAYSRGNSTMQVMYRHVLKNALIPLVTFWSMSVADMIAGAIVIEQVFNIPGLGRILLSSIQNRDYPVVEAVIMLIALVVVVMNLLSDILCRKIDPRLKS